MKFWEIKNSTPVSIGPKSGGIDLGEYIVRWDYNGEGQIIITLNDENDKVIKSVEHTKLNENGKV